jgi:thioester reductase-like protein
VAHPSFAQVITGTTGALGAHLLDQVLHHPKSHFSEIVCLCRAADDHSAYERVQASLAQRCLPALFTLSETKVICLAARLGDDSLGLKPGVYEDLRRRATDIIHAAWAVNFVGGLRSFESDHIRGVHNLIRLASPHVLRTMPASFYFCSSGATVLGRPPSEPIPESIPQDPHSAAPMGYARSKWVAEHLCEAASRGPLSGHVSVLRIGQLCGDTRSGVWNESEGWPLMLRTVDEVGMLPDLAQDVMWLPIDLAASAIMDIITNPDTFSGGGCPVFHIMNPNSVSWSNVCGWLREFGKTFEEVPPKTWVTAVSNSESAVEKNPSRKLLGLWVSQVSDSLASLCSETHASSVRKRSDCQARTLVQHQPRGFSGPWIGSCLR